MGTRLTITVYLLVQLGHSHTQQQEHKTHGDEMRPLFPSALRNCQPESCSDTDDTWQQAQQNTENAELVHHKICKAFRLVEVSGIEPLTSCMPCKRSPS